MIVADAATSARPNDDSLHSCLILRVGQAGLRGSVAWLEATRAAVSKVKQHNHDTLEVSTGSSKSSFGECFKMSWDHVRGFATHGRCACGDGHGRQGLGMVRHAGNRWG